VSQPKVRAAVIGLGRHGFRHLQAYQRVDTIELTAVCDLSADQVATALEQFDGIMGYTEWEELLRNEQLDLVCIVTNGPSHAPITIAAAQSGIKHIFCEKPMATSLQDARAMIQTCDAHGTRLAVSHTRRWFKSYRELQVLLADGLIGTLSHLWLTCGGGLFAGNGTHIMDLARMLSGSEPTSVVGTIDKTGTPNPRGHQFLDPGAVALYWFENGMRFVIDMFEDLGVPPRIEIVGSMGRILIDEGDERWEILARQGADREQPTSHYWLPLAPVAFQPAALDMVEMLAEGFRELIGKGEISCSGKDGLASLEMLIAAHASSQDGSALTTWPLSQDFSKMDLQIT
jgi:predicted dehydrogenase